MLRSIFTFGFCLGFWLLSCGRFESDSPFCFAQEDCLKGYLCQEGVCSLPPEALRACPPQQQLCGEVCVDTQTDEFHCGGCGEACLAEESCREGICVAPAEPETCPPPQQLCGEVCVELQSNASHCGDCENGCPSGASCQQGQCVCPSGMTHCQGRCRASTEYWFDPNNCGRCSNVCRGLCLIGHCIVWR